MSRSVPRHDQASTVAIRRSQGGLLVELILALFVFALAGTGIAGAYLSSHSLTMHAKDTEIALEDLRDMMERIHATTFPALPGAFPEDASCTNPNTNYATLVGEADTDGDGTPDYDLNNERLIVDYTPDPVGGIPVDPSELTVTVCWNQSGRWRTASLTTMRTAR